MVLAWRKDSTPARQTATPMSITAIAAPVRQLTAASMPGISSDNSHINTPNSAATKGGGTRCSNPFMALVPRLFDFRQHQVTQRLRPELNLLSSLA
ncbi:hypothetical protein D3C78_1487120 [compost metagenome]